MQVWYIALVIIALDQGSKWLIQQGMTLHESIPVIPGFFHITYILNRGAAFGILENQRWLFLIMAILLFVLYAVFRKKLPEHRAVQAGAGMLLGGAFGNAWTAFCTELSSTFSISASGQCSTSPISASSSAYACCCGTAGHIFLSKRGYQYG